MEGIGPEFVFRKDEISRLLSLTSLNFVKFTLNAKEYLPEQFFLFKACRIYENELLKLLSCAPDTLDAENRKLRELHAVYLELGNINLLAQDFARALCAYQKAYLLDKNDFWRDASGLYGLGLIYLHFRAYRPAIESFCQLIFCHPHLEVITEVHARLGIAYKCLQDFPQALKHLLIASDDAKELNIVPKYQLRFHIAHCYDGFGDFRRAIEEYRRLLADHERGLFRLPVELLAVVHRQLGWISLRSREDDFKENIRCQKLREAEQQLIKARELTPTDSKTNCYLGLCFSEQTVSPLALLSSTPPNFTTVSSGGVPTTTNNNNANNNNNGTFAGSSSGVASGGTPSTPLNSSGSTGRQQPTQSNSATIQGHTQQKQQQQVAADKAQDAFISYRSAIDSDESDANTWCSIGVLYQQQNQPLDALQAFACAVQLNDKHSAAWTELGRLYEAHRQYKECLHCYRKALQHNPVCPEILRFRVNVLEKEFGAPGAAVTLLNHLQSANQHSASTSNSRISLLPPLENAWQLGIPAQVRQRLSDLHKQQENRYREGSLLWSMSELSAHAMRQSFYDLDPTQRQIMQVLQMNKRHLESNELELLKQLEDRYNCLLSNNGLNNNNDYASELSSENARMFSSRSLTTEIKSSSLKSPVDETSGMTFVLNNEARNSPRKTQSLLNEDVQLRVNSAGSGDELKLRISRTNASSSYTGAASNSISEFPYITQDDLTDVLGDDFDAKTSKTLVVDKDSDLLLTAALEEHSRQHPNLVTPKASPKSAGVSPLSNKSGSNGHKRRANDDKYVQRKQAKNSTRSPTPLNTSSTSNNNEDEISRNSSVTDNDNLKEAENSKRSVATVSALDLQEQRITSTASAQIAGDLPPAFSLLAPVRVPITVSSAEVFEMCQKRRMRSEDFRPIFDECVAPPRPPQLPKKRPNKDSLLLRTPLIVVENPREAMTTELQNFCYNSPIALIHGLTGALKIDLSQFSSKSMISAAADHEVEVRTQYKMPGDANLDHLGNPTWRCHSTKSFTTVCRYGQYQAESFRYCLKEETEKLKQSLPSSTSSTTSSAQQQSSSNLRHNNNNIEGLSPTSSTTSYHHYHNQRHHGQQNGATTSKRRRTTISAGAGGASTGNGAYAADCVDSNVTGAPLKTIKFGTNIDLSDERKFHAQMRELNKMPAFCRISAACNMLTHLGHTVLGMNTVQLYLKVPGCRTPGHLENNSFASININVGPGECEWFGVPYEYWPVIEQMCKERNIDFLKGAWWPSFQDLINADVPFYRFTQRAGDMVWVGGGCVHWVQSTGWCNNVAWNVGPMTANQMEMALYAHEWNRLNTYRSLVPMQHLAWQLARDVRFTNQKMFNVIKNVLIRSLAYCRMIADFVERRAKMSIKFQSRQKGETAHYCYLCDIEVFNLLFVKEISSKFRVFCVQCARKNDVDDYVVLQQIPFEELADVFDRFQLHPSKAALIC